MNRPLAMRRVDKAWAGGGGGPELFWELADPLGTGLLLVDATGQRASELHYTPFGETRQALGFASSLRDHYAGHRVDEASGLVYMNARWYEPGAGRFVSVDPLLRTGAPQSHNGYSYVENNPVAANDPTGMCTPHGEGCGGSAGAARMALTFATTTYWTQVSGSETTANEQIGSDSRSTKPTTGGSAADSTDGSVNADTSNRGGWLSSVGRYLAQLAKGIGGEVISTPLLALRGAGSLFLGVATIAIRDAGLDPPSIVDDGNAIGAIQIPAGKEPICLGPDGVTMGGYVKIACLIVADMDRMAQLRIGDSMRFQKVTVDEARDILKQKVDMASEENIEKI